jgi:hypothetical protein
MIGVLQQCSRQVGATTPTDSPFCGISFQGEYTWRSSVVVTGNGDFLFISLLKILFGDKNLLQGENP